MDNISYQIGFIEGLFLAQKQIEKHKFDYYIKLCNSVKHKPNEEIIKYNQINQ